MHSLRSRQELTAADELKDEIEVVLVLEELHQMENIFSLPALVVDFDLAVHLKVSPGQSAVWNTSLKIHKAKNGVTC